MLPCKSAYVIMVLPIYNVAKYTLCDMMSHSQLASLFTLLSRNIVRPAHTFLF